MESQDKLRTLTDAVAMIGDGMTLAIGGRANQRVPMALLREIARHKKHGLRIVRLDPAMNLGAFAHADCTFMGGNEGLLRARLQAAAMGVAFMSLDFSTDSYADFTNHHAIEAVDDPFNGGTVLVTAALRPDVAVIHAHMADRFGNIVMDADWDANTTFDATLARAAKHVIVSVEQIVSEETTRRGAHHMLLHADEVACVVEAPYGAHPSACDARYAHDAEPVRETLAHHDTYLQEIGARRLFSLTRRFASRL